jgi:hypothetical protein
MKNDPDPQLDALFAAARANISDTSPFEYGFETRLIARLREESGASLFAWAWRLCPFFAALALAVAWWTQANASAEVYSHFIAEAAPGSEELFTYLTGDRR